MPAADYRVNANRRLLGGTLPTPIIGSEPLLKQVGVPLLAARAAYNRGTPEHMRMALITIDGATELLLRRNVVENEVFFRLGEQTRELVQRGAEVGKFVPLPVLEVQFPLAEHGGFARNGAALWLSKTQRKRLRDNFGPNVDIAQLLETLSAGEASTLRILHDYRNDAYHNGIVDEAAIEALVQLQLFTAAALLRSMRFTIGGPLRSEQELAALRDHIGLAAEHDFSSEGIADAITAGIALDDALIARALSQSLLGRLEYLERLLEEIARFLGPAARVFPDDAWLFVMADVPVANIVELRALPAGNPPAIRREWAKLALEVAAAEGAHDAIARFSAVDAPLRHALEQGEEVANEIDYLVDMEISRRRDMRSPLYSED